MTFTTVGTPAVWGAFFALIALLLFLDLFAFHRKAHAVRISEAFWFSVFWIALALIFNGWVWFHFGRERGLEFLAGYLVEKALSVDNIFVFLIIFRYFAVPKEFQHRVLFLGIVGALLMRGLFIFLGTSLIQQFHWIEYLFGALLIWTGVKLFRESDIEVEPEKNPLVRLTRKLLPVSNEYRGAKFAFREGGKLIFTPLFVVLVAVEASDLVFAIDSIPAIFAITTDPFIVFTSNIFAILGLRALYFLLAGALGKLEYLRFGLAFVLAFVGVKMVVSDFYKVPIGLSLSVIAGALAISIISSLFHKGTAQPFTSSTD